MKYIDAEKIRSEVERIKEAGCASPISVCNDILSFIDFLQQEQPEVDLEKEMDKYYGMYRDKTGKTYDIKDGEPCFDWKEDGLSEHEMRFARHFYELARQKYEK